MVNKFWIIWIFGRFLVVVGELVGPYWMVWCGCKRRYEGLLYIQREEVRRHILREHLRSTKGGTLCATKKYQSIASRGLVL